MSKISGKPTLRPKPGVSPKPAGTFLEDRDLLSWPEFQAFYRDVAKQGAPVATFKVASGQTFDVVCARRPVDPPDDDDERAALGMGYEILLMFGAIAQDDGHCYAALGLYVSDNLQTVREKSLEVDVNHRRRRIGGGLFAAAVRSVEAQLGKSLALSNVFSPAGKQFAEWARTSGII